jgi:DNA helicase HerA-like ATPase
MQKERVTVSRVVARTNLVKPPEPPARYLVPREDGIAVYIGHTEILRKPVFWRPEDLINYHMVVLGSSGSGKTCFVRTLTLRAAMSFGANVLVFDVSGEYAPFAEMVGRHVIQLGIKHFLNIMDLGGIPPAVRAAQVVEAMQPFFDTDRATRQARILRDAVDLAYAEKGITDDPDTWDREPPTLGDAYRILRNLWRDVITKEYEDKEYENEKERELVLTFANSTSARESLVGLLDKLRAVTEPPHDYLARQSTLTLKELTESGYVVLDLSRLPNESARMSVTTSVLQYIVEDMRRRGVPAEKGLWLLLVIDEAWKAISQSNSPVKTLVKESRKYGIGVIAATQDLSDIKEDDYLLNNAGSTFILMIQKDTDRESISKTLGLSQYLRERFNDLLVGQCIVKLRYANAAVPPFVTSVRAILPEREVRICINTRDPLIKILKRALERYRRAKRY